MVQPSENEWSLFCFNQELFSNIKLNEKANRHLSATAGYRLNKVRKHSNTKYHLEMHTCQTSIKIAVGIFSTKFIVITSGERDREGSERIQGSLWLYLQDFLKKVMEKQESHLGVHTASFYKEGNLATSIKVTWRRHWWPTPVLLPGDAHGQRNLAGYGPWGHKELDTTEHLTLPTSWQNITAFELLCVSIKHVIPVKAGMKVDPWFWAVLLSHQLAQARVKPVCEDWLTRNHIFMCGL